MRECEHRRHALRPGSGRSQRLYAKLYLNAQDAAKAFGIANRVVDWLADNNQGLQGNRPKAVSREDGVIFYPHAPGIPLSHQLNRSRRWLAIQLQMIGRGLAILHNGPETLQAELKQNTFGHEVKVVKRASEHIQVLLPETHDKILEIVDRAEEHYSKLPQENPTFTHSDFTLKGISGVEEAQAELIKGYLGEGEPDHTVRERLRRARLFHVLILAKIVVRRVPLFRKEWAATTARMIERSAQVLSKTKDL